MIRKWIPIAHIKSDIPERTLREWCESGKIRARKIKKEWHIDVADMLERNGFDELAEDVRGGKTKHVDK